ncbi:hypothetical protein GBA52_003887 [Prunus armeniaca]|nr:hypothetical protein GBA52_003887 [Prunus armeniaca]
MVPKGLTMQDRAHGVRRMIMALATTEQRKAALNLLLTARDIVLQNSLKCRLAAIFQAAVSMSNQGVKVFPEISVPLLNTFRHDPAFLFLPFPFMSMQSSIFMKTLTFLQRQCHGGTTCIKIAAEAEFFSFGTNRFTQMTFGYSRDDVGKFLPIYLSKGLLQNDPFERCRAAHQDATEKGRAARPSLKVTGNA